MKKIDVHNACVSILKERAEMLSNIIESAHESLVEDIKSSAGDKYETNREMMEAEKEKASNQMRDIISFDKSLRNIKLSELHEKIKYGSLVETNLGWFYVSIPLGQLKLNDEKVFAISILSPMGKALEGVKKGDKVEVNGNKVSVINVY